MKLTVNFGDELKNAKIECPKFLPVTRNGECIGEAIIQADGMAEVHITNEDRMSELRDFLELGVGGAITSRDGDLITGFDLREVSIHWKGINKPNK